MAAPLQPRQGLEADRKVFTRRYGSVSEDNVSVAADGEVLIAYATSKRLPPDGPLHLVALPARGRVRLSLEGRRGGGPHRRAAQAEARVEAEQLARPQEHDPPSTPERQVAEVAPAAASRRRGGSR